MFSLIDSLLRDPLDDELKRQKLTNGKRDDDSDLSLAAEDKEEFEEEQNLVARFVHLVYNEDIDTHFKVRLYYV